MRLGKPADRAPNNTTNVTRALFLIELSYFSF